MMTVKLLKLYVDIRNIQINKNVFAARLCCMAIRSVVMCIILEVNFYFELLEVKHFQYIIDSWKSDFIKQLNTFYHCNLI